MGKGVAVGAKQRKQRSTKCHHQHGKDNTSCNCNVKTKRTHALRAVKVILTKQSRDQRASTLTVDVAEGHQGGENRGADRDTGDQCRIICLGNKKGVREVVDQCHNESEDNREGHFKVGSVQMAGIKNCIHRYDLPFWKYKLLHYGSRGKFANAVRERQWVRESV